MDTKLILTGMALGLTMLNISAAPATPAAKTQPTEKAEFKVMDAKFMTAKERAKWVAQMRSSLPMAKRAIGPFGYTQTPGALVKKVNQAPKRSHDFSKAVDAFKVTAVMPGQDKFVIGAREFREGEVIPVEFGGKLIHVNVVSVQMDQIIFKDMRSGEVKKKNMNELPSGMTRDTNITTVPGVTPVGAGKAEPLKLSQ